jgi:hypothetical protein
MRDGEAQRDDAAVAVADQVDGPWDVQCVEERGEVGDRVVDLVAGGWSLG